MLSDNLFKRLYPYNGIIYAPFSKSVTLSGSGAILTGGLVGIDCLEQRNRAWNFNGEELCLIFSMVTQETVVGRFITYSTVNGAKNWILTGRLFLLSVIYGEVTKQVVLWSYSILTILSSLWLEYRQNLRIRINEYLENFGKTLSRVINLTKTLKEFGSFIVEMFDVMNKREMLIEGTKAL